ncbi:MAG TPA: SDR family oxidoreductase [Oscillatoriaceae cyanobacterium M33_DOE_052]|uniref:SDR family oxidoreductase n=1 Tax=Planktothricoides sp. SpSt-374 TaxID=2282167 RepID=A0A7C3ZY85_9CYAN|nr:SDR family oxidoreductase [Oscillatoriaceae cyanobacterium M33_DOE_052]
MTQKVVIIGGSSGMGLAIAKAAVAKGKKVIIASRSAAKLNKAKAEIGGDVESELVDITLEVSVKELFAKIGNYDALLLTPSVGVNGPFMEVDIPTARQAFENKFWGSYYAAKYGAAGLDKTNGSITFFSGSVVEKPSPGLSLLAAINGGLEALAKSLAVELAPIRVNVVSPGLVVTPLYSGIPEAYRQNYFDSVAMELPLKRVGQPEDIAELALFLIENKYMTGAVINIDGGVRLV